MCLKKGAPAPPPKGECGEALRTLTSTTAANVWFISAATATTAGTTYTAATTACSWP
jgi:hypothetical protein